MRRARPAPIATRAKSSRRPKRRSRARTTPSNSACAKRGRRRRDAQGRRAGRRRQDAQGRRRRAGEGAGKAAGRGSRRRASAGCRPGAARDRGRRPESARSAHSLWFGRLFGRARRRARRNHAFNRDGARSGVGDACAGAAPALVRRSQERHGLEGSPSADSATSTRRDAISELSRRCAARCAARYLAALAHPRSQTPSNRTSAHPVR